MDDVTEDSLVLVDELGKGTEVRAGAAIAGAMLERLDTIGCRGIFATSVFFIVTIPCCSSSSPPPSYSSSSALLNRMVPAGSVLKGLDTIGCRGIFATLVFFFITVLDSSSSSVFPFFFCIAWQGGHCRGRGWGIFAMSVFFFIVVAVVLQKRASKVKAGTHWSLRLWKSRLTIFRSACCDLLRSSSSLNT